MNEQPQPEMKGTYRIWLLNGQQIDVTSIFEWDVFWIKLKADGYVVSPTAYIPYHSIASVQKLEQKPALAVVQTLAPQQIMP